MFSFSYNRSRTKGESAFLVLLLAVLFVAGHSLKIQFDFKH